MIGVRRAVLLMAVFSLVAGSAMAAGSDLRGVARDEKGIAVANLLFSILRSDVPEAPEIFTARTDKRGGFRVLNLTPGDYLIRIKNSQFKPLSATRFQLRSGQSLNFTLVLQQLVDLLPEQKGKNLDIKTILRTSSDNRMILRNTPGATGSEPAASAFTGQNAALQWYSAAPLSGSFFALPGEAQGMATNFAVSQSLPGLATYTFAGQLNSGNDSIWKVRNFVSQPIGDRSELQVALGFSRVSYDQPSLSMLANPGRLSEATSFLDAVGIVKNLSLSVHNAVRVADPLRLVVGLDIDQLKSRTTRSFINPHLEVEYTPTDSTLIYSLVTSRRSSQSNSVPLPSGETVSLADSFHMSKIRDRLHFGGMRYYEAGASQRIGDSDWLEVAGFYTDAYGETSPFLALLGTAANRTSSVLFLDQRLARSRGTRFSYRHKFLPELSTKLSYAMTRAAGLDTAGSVETFDPARIADLTRRGRFHSLTAQMDAHLSPTHTHLTAIVRVVPGKPIGTVDPFTDTYDVGNQGVNLFIRQMIPFPDMLGFSPRLEALLDLRNALNDDLGPLQTRQGQVVFVKNPRSIRGGLSVNF
ncbi:MAG: carboxypeptidase regulatory-like domain-containing protein [Acidobacteriota bacterium]